MKPISWAFLLLAAHSAFAPQLAAQELDLPRGAIRRLGSTDLRQDHVLSAAYTPDHSKLITAGRDIRVWDAHTRKPLLAIPLKNPSVRKMQISPDGKKLYAFADIPGCVLGFDLETGKELTRVVPTEKNVFFSTFALAPDGLTLATGGFLKDKKTGEELSDLVLWNIATGEKVRTFPGHQRSEKLGPEFKTYLHIDSVIFSPDGKLLASISGAQDDATRVFEVATGQGEACPAPLLALVQRRGPVDLHA